MMTPQNPDLEVLLQDKYNTDSLARIRSFLEDKGTLTLSPLTTGLFSAALTTNYSKGTNYHAAWVRDNVQVAHAHLATGKPEVAAQVARSLCKFFAMQSQKERFQKLIDDPSQKDDLEKAMQRPHIRFNGDTLEELPQWWDHAQNDALGYFIWLYAEIVLYPLSHSPPSAPLIKPEEWENDLDTLSLFLEYFKAIEYWKDADGGHWEETRKVAASSIGAVRGGLLKLLEWREKAEEITTGYERSPINPYPYYYNKARKAFPEQLLNDLIGKGSTALLQILPNECSQGTPKQLRKYDSALLFLVYPLNSVGDALAETIVSQIETHLRGPIGIKRYLGDSFYCTDFEKLSAEQKEDPTRNRSQDIASRDALFTPGGEAQWCLFDPIISVYYGRRYKQTRSGEDLRKQTEYLNRSLCQITKADPPRCEAFQCPELYYVEDGKLQVSKSTPLLWTQANLLVALETMRVSLELESGVPFTQLRKDQAR